MRSGCFITATLLACPALASAHQPYESSAVGQLDHGRLELTVITSAEIAVMLAGAPMSEVVALDSLRPQLLKVGADLYEVTAGGQTLQPERVFFDLRGGEAAFSVIYPVMRADGLRFRAAYLNKLPRGYGGALEVFDDAGNLLGRAPLLKKGETNDTFTISPPMTGSTPIGTSVNATSPATAASGQPPSAPATSERAVNVPNRNWRFLPWIASLISVLLLLLSIWRFGRLRR